MTTPIERVRDMLEAAGIEVDEVRPLPTGLGNQLRCAGGAVVVVYNTGKVVAQGKGAEAAKVALQGFEAPVKAPSPKPSAKPKTASLPLAPVPRLSPAGASPSRLWTDEPWNGVDLPWDPVS